MRKNEYFVLDAAGLEDRAKELHDGYAAAKPFPHAVIDNFLPDDIAEAVHEAFPQPDAPFWLDWKKRDTVHQPLKQGIGTAGRLAGAPPVIHNAMSAFNSYPFINFLEKLTGIEGLIPDPHLHGGGLHQILPGGKLVVHADFNYLPKLGLYRRINALFYLNKDWKREYNGYLELWDKNMENCVAEIEPRFNRMVIFNTSKYSFHGHPKTLSCPEGMTRKSIALYFYHLEPHKGEEEKYEVTWQDQCQKQFAES